MSYRCPPGYRKADYGIVGRDGCVVGLPCLPADDPGIWCDCPPGSHEVSYDGSKRCLPNREPHWLFREPQPWHMTAEYLKYLDGINYCAATERKPGTYPVSYTRADGRRMIECRPPAVALGAETTDLPSGDWGQLVTKDDYRYQLTNRDILTAARMLYGEGVDEAVLWATAQRFAGIPMRRERHGTYTDLMTKWSEPLMEARTSTGSYCLAHRDSPRCTPEKMRRRELIQAAGWRSIPAGMSGSRWQRAKDLVVRWARGEVPNPVPFAVDMAAPSVRSTKPVVARRGGNIFYTQPADVRGWSTDQVTLHFMGRVAGPSLTGRLRARLVQSPELIPIFGMAALATAGGFAYWAWRRARRR